MFQVAPDRGGSTTKNTLRISNQTLGTFRGGSLPNVSAGAPTVKTATHIKDSNKVILVCFLAFFLLFSEMREKKVLSYEGNKKKKRAEAVKILYVNMGIFDFRGLL